MDEYLFRIAFGDEDGGRRAVKAQRCLALHHFLHVDRAGDDKQEEEKIDPHAQSRSNYYLIQPVGLKKQQSLLLHFISINV